MATWFMGSLIMLVGGGPNELVALIPTGTYWRIQGVEVSVDAMLAEITEPEAQDVPALVKDLGADEFAVREAAQKKLSAMGPGVVPQLAPATKADDPEVATRAREIIAKMQAGEKNRDVRRLMAIRTLGELKAKEALPALRKLTKSDELFVADHAARSIAAIEGAKHPLPGLSAELRMKDVWLLPKGCGLVAQVTLGGEGKFDLEKAIAGMMPPGMGGDPADVSRQATRGLLEIAERIGNVRVDVATVGLAGDIGARSGYIVLAVRGLYNSARAKAALRQMHGQRSRPLVETVGGVDIYKPDREVAMMFPSDRRFVLIGGPARDLLPVAEVAQAVSSGRGTLADNKELAVLIRSADRDAPLWAAATMTETYRGALSIFAPLKTATFAARKTPEGTVFALKAAGEDARKVKEAAAEFDGMLKQAIEQAKEAAGDQPLAKLALEFLKGVKVSQDGGEVRVSALLKEGGQAGIMMAPLLFISRARRGGVERVRAASQPVRPARRGAPSRPVRARPK